MSSMRAAVLTETGTLEIRTVDRPKVGPDTVLVAVHASGICGSDLATYQGNHPYKRPPVVLGHEFAGVVEQVGGRVRRFARGDRVCAASFAACGTCAQCRSGSTNLCTARRNLSHGGSTGSFAEFVAIEESMTYRLPDALGMEAGALIEPLSIGWHAVQLAAATAPAIVGVLGTGSIGAACALWADRQGWSTSCLDINPAKSELARRVGATEFVALSPDVVAPSPADGFDATFVTSGHPQALDDAMRLTRPGGTVVAVAYFADRASVDANSLVQSEIAVRGSALSCPDDFRHVLAEVGLGTLDPRVLITDRFALQDAAQAMEVLASGTALGKVMLGVGDARASVS